MSAVITIQFIVPTGYAEGDYAQLHGNGGSGAIDWETPLSAELYDLFAGGAGIYGWGLAPWGRFRWGRAHVMRTPGWGHLPWGLLPWGHGTTVIQARHTVDSCGDHLFALACYDRSGNIHEGSAQEISVPVHIAPPVPTGLLQSSYNKQTDVLVLDAA